MTNDITSSNGVQGEDGLNKKDADTFAATLSFATRLSEQLLPKAPQTQETGATSDVEQKDELDTAKEEKVDLEAKIKDLRKEMKAMIKDEISEIKEVIKESLEDDKE